MKDVRRWMARGAAVAFGTVATIGVLNANQAGSQTTPSLPPGFTLPTFPTIPTVPTSPPPTMPPETTTTTGPPPTMPPSSTTTLGVPPTMPPQLSPRTDELIEDLISELEEFGDRFAEVIEELRTLQERF